MEAVATAEDLARELTPARIAWYRVRPIAFVRRYFGVEPDPQQKKVLMAIVYTDSVAVKSGHGVGKSSVMAWLTLWFITLFDHARVVATAPTQRQLLDILWPEIQKWLSRSPLQLWIEWKATRVVMRGNEETWFATARTSNKPENMQGFHAEHIMYLIDEAPGVPQTTMEAVEGALTTAHCKILMAGNPTRLSGTFFDAFHRLRAFYTTITLNSEESTLVSESYWKRLGQKYGRDSNLYRVRVSGEFPRGEPDVLIGLDEVEAAVVREVEADGIIAIGCDPARYGDAETVIYWRHGYKVYEPVVRQGINTSWTTGEIARLVRRIRAEEVYGERIPVMVDETGIGAGVVDQLEELSHELWITVVPVNFGGKGSDQFDNTASLMLGDLQESLPLMQLPDDDDTIAQLTTRKYRVMPNGKIKIESKDEMRARGLPSPDRADALGLCFHSGTSGVTMSDETRKALRARRGGGR